MGLSDQYIVGALEGKITNVTTKNTYIHKLKKLQEHLKGAALYDILRSPEKYFSMIKTAYPESACTQKNMVGVLLSAYKYIPVLLQKKPAAYNRWLAIRKQLESQCALNESKAPKITREELRDKYLALKQNYAHSKNLTMRFILLSMLVNIVPTFPKADFGNMAIVRAPAKQSPLPDYVYLRSNGSGFAMLKGQKREIPPELVEDIEKSLKYHPREYLITDRENNPYEKTNSFNTFVIRAFQAEFGKRIGVNEIKHVLK